MQGTGMVGAERIDKIHPMAESFAEAKSALDEVFRLYKWRRHAKGFPEEAYLLLSRCAYVCFSLWCADEESQGDFFRRSPPPLIFWIGLDFGELRGSEPEEPVSLTDWRADHLTNDTKWFAFWMKTLEQSDPRGAPPYREFSRHILACVGHRNLLEVKTRYRSRKALNSFLRQNEAGGVLLRTIFVLEDFIQAILRYFSTLDGRTCVLEKIALLTGLLSEMRQILVWETPASGPYSPSDDARWRVRSPLTWLSRDRTQGVLTVIPKREGGEIICIYRPPSSPKGRRHSWVRKVASLKGSYEEALFATWSYDTGEHRKNPQQFPGVTACWTVQYAEAQRLETLSRQIDLLLAALQGNPRCQGLVEAVRSILRNGCPRWKNTALPWTYVRQVDQLLDKLILVYREASTVGGHDAAERVVAQNWASEETTTAGVGPERGPDCPEAQASREAASQDMTLALGEVKYVLPKANQDMLDKREPSSGSCAQSPPGPLTQDSRPTVTSPEVKVEATVEKPPEKPEPSEQSPGAEVETTVGKPPEEPELAERSPEAALETAMEKLPEEPELSEQCPEAEVETTVEELPNEPEPSKPSPEVTLETAMENPPEESELSGERVEAKGETKVEELPNEPKPSEPRPQAMLETASEKPDLSGEDPGIDGPAPVHEENSTVGAPDATSGLEPLLPAEVAISAQPTETDAAPAVVAASPEESVQEPARRKRTADASRRDETTDALLRRLLEHHGCPAGTINYEPLSAAALQRDLGWNQSKVQRTMTNVFGPKPVNAYRSKCNDRTILTFLRAYASGIRLSVEQDALA